MAMKRKNLVEIIPFMMNITIQFVIGNRILSTLESKFVLADNHQNIG